MLPDAPAAAPSILPVRPGGRFRSNSRSRSRSLELMYMSAFVVRPVVLLPQLSCARCCDSSVVGPPAAPRSMDKLPMLCVSSFLEVVEPGDDGRDVMLPLLRIKFRKPDPPLSRLGLRALGLFAPVKGEYPLVGLEVRIVGGLAASLSRDVGGFAVSWRSDRA